MKFLLSLLVVLLIGTSCSKVIELPMPNAEETIVVESFFSPEDPWKVKLYKLFSGYDPPELITGAAVFLIQESSDTIVLTETDAGYYSSSEFPVVDKLYTLRVIFEDVELSASSKIPELTEIKNINILLEPAQSAAANLYIGDHSLVSFTLEPTNTVAYSRIRILEFNKDYSYKYHLIDHSVQEKLQSILSVEEYQAISDLFGDTIYGNNMHAMLSDRLWDMGLFDNLDTILSLSYMGELDYMHPEAFELQLCYSPNNQYYQNFNESMTLLGYYDNSFLSEVYMKDGLINNDDSIHDVYLEYIDINEDFYNYQRDYILQVTKRYNLSESPIIVYSNIENGTGIFAGYQRRIFRLDEI